MVQNIGVGHGGTLRGKVQGGGSLMAVVKALGGDFRLQFYIYTH